MGPLRAAAPWLPKSTPAWKPHPGSSWGDVLGHVPMLCKGMGAKTPPCRAVAVPKTVSGPGKGRQGASKPCAGAAGGAGGEFRRGDAAPAPSRGGCRVVPVSSNPQCPPVRALGTVGDSTSQAVTSCRPQHCSATGCHHLGVPTPSPRAPRGTEGPPPSSRLRGCVPKTAPFLGSIPRFLGQCHASCRHAPLCSMQTGASLSRRITPPGTKPRGLCQPPSN